MTNITLEVVLKLTVFVSFADGFDNIFSCALLSFRKGKFLHHYENYGATANDIADWMKK